MPSHRVGGSGGGKEGQSSEPYYVKTKGGVVVAPVIYTNGLPGDPPKPKMRGDAKTPGTGGFPTSHKLPSGASALGAFGFTKNQKGKGG